MRGSRRAAKTRYGAIVERLAELTTRFMQNVLADETSYRLRLIDERDLAGLPEDVRAAARAAAQERGDDAAGIVTLSRSLIVPFLTFSDRRDLREQAFKAWVQRGEHDGAHDNRPLAREILALRNEQAKLHGYRHYADYALVDRMAGTPEAVARLLRQVWEPAKARAAAERDALRALAESQGATHAIEPWDWRYYAEKVRKARYRMDDALLKPYFSLDRMLAAAFDTAHRLFGLRFVERTDIKAYHPDVRTFEVRGADERLIGVFLSDNFARPNKRGGAWMNAYRWQSRANGETLPIVVNNNNFAKGAGGRADAPVGRRSAHAVPRVRTRAARPPVAGDLRAPVRHARAPRLRRIAVAAVRALGVRARGAAAARAASCDGQAHPRRADPAPQEARRFNQGFETVEYTASALLDMALHAQEDPAGVDITAFERAELARIGMPREIVPRHRLPHFGHLFASAGYAAGYYVYLWAEVLDADGYDAFLEAGDPFDPKVAERVRRYVYSSGGTLAPAEAYRLFRGRDPRVEPLLAQRGLAEAPQPA